MKKTLTILSAIIITLISFNAKAQDDKPEIKSYLGILGGISFPGGDFGKADYSNNNAGFAKKGTTFALDAAVYLYKNFGIGATFSFQDQGELSDNDAQTLSNGYNASFQKDETSVTAVNRYHNVFLMAGPQYSFILNKFIIDLRASAGVVKSISTPNVSVVFDDGTDTVVEPNQLSSTGRAFAYGGSAGLRYTFSDNWDVGLKANYVTSSGINISNTDDPGTTGRFVTKLPITVLETTVGITLHL